MPTHAEAGNGNIRRGNAKLAAVSRGFPGWVILRAGMAKRELVDVKRPQRFFEKEVILLYCPGRIL